MKFLNEVILANIYHKKLYGYFMINIEVIEPELVYGNSKGASISRLIPSFYT